MGTCLPLDDSSCISKDLHDPTRPFGLLLGTPNLSCLDENGNSHEIKNKAKFQFRSSGVIISPIEIMERLQSGSKFKQADMPISC
jgi:hypothetical protein